MHTRAIISASLLALCAAPAFAADDGTWDYWVRAQVTAGQLALGGDASYTDGTIPATNFDVGDVGLDDGEIAPGFELGVTTPILSFHGWLGYQQWSTEGSTTLTQNLNFGGIGFTAGDTLSSEASLTDLYVEFAWGPIELDVAGFAIGIAAHQLSLQTKLSSGLAGSAEFDESGTVPTLSLRGYVAPLDMLEVEAMVHGLAVPIGDASGSFFTGQIQASYYPFSYLGVIAGYKHTAIDIEYEDGSRTAKANVTLSGPFLGLAAQF